MREYNIYKIFIKFNNFINIYINIILSILRRYKLLIIIK